MSSGSTSGRPRENNAWRTFVSSVEPKELKSVIMQGISMARVASTAGTLVRRESPQARIQVHVVLEASRGRSIPDRPPRGEAASGSRVLHGVCCQRVSGTVEEYPAFGAESRIPEVLFDKHVTLGHFVKREFVGIRMDRGYRLRRVLYARQTEAWRIDAYILLCHTAEVTGWNESLERAEGFLLGYEEWQTGLHIAASRAQKEAKLPTTSD